MIQFTIEPFVGPLPLRFGMTPEQVEGILGPPDSIRTSYFGTRIEQRPHFGLGFSKDDATLDEAVFAPGATVLFKGHDLFAEPDLVSTLRRYDSETYLWVGSVVYFHLGILISGYHDSDESQKAIAVVCKGYWDEYAAKFIPYDMRT